jgi:ADP-ribosyl-[dinitrogen reductase] hydrolase
MTPAVLVGLAVGDALGMPFELPRDDTHGHLKGWDGNYREGTYHKLPAGHWTDDTEMALCLAESLVAYGHFNPDDVAKRYLAWSRGTPHGMGSTTRRAMRRLADGHSWSRSGVQIEDAQAVGNGTAMRIAPLGLLYSNNDHSLPVWAAVDAVITHNHIEAFSASVLVARAVSLSVERPTMDLAEVASMAAYKTLGGYVVHEVQRALASSGWSDDDAASFLGRRGNAIQTVSSAFFYAIRYQDSFEKGVQAAVRAGGDTDTRAAIVGALLGARLGLEGIPERYLAGLHRVDWLKLVDAELAKLRVTPLRTGA